MSYIKQMSILWLGAIFVLFFALPGIGQITEKTFSHLTVDEGLSQSSVYAITQDTRGFMWFGTRDGLNRYDSRKVVVYQNQRGNKQSLAANTINSLLLDEQGSLWVGTTKGLARYRPDLDNFQRISAGGIAANGLPDSTINSLLEEIGRAHV